MPITEELLRKSINANTLGLENKEITHHGILLITDFLNTHPEIKVVILNLDQIDNTGVRALSAISSLKTLILFGNSITALGASFLSGNKYLTTLDLSANNNVGNPGAIALARSSTLISLTLGSCLIGDEGAKALAANSILTSLNLYQNRIGDEGAIAFENNTSLKRLVLRANAIRDKGAIALATNTCLTWLDVERNKIYIEGSKALVMSKSLNSLNINGNFNSATSSIGNVACFINIMYAVPEGSINLCVYGYPGKVRTIAEQLTMFIDKLSKTRQMALAPRLSLINQVNCNFVNKEPAQCIGKTITPIIEIDDKRITHIINALEILNTPMAYLTAALILDGQLETTVAVEPEDLIEYWEGRTQLAISFYLKAGIGPNLKPFTDLLLWHIKITTSLMSVHMRLAAFDIPEPSKQIEAYDQFHHVPTQALLPMTKDYRFFAKLARKMAEEHTVEDESSPRLLITRDNSG